jgi:hypothetical protein
MIYDWDDGALKKKRIIHADIISPLIQDMTNMVLMKY